MAIISVSSRNGGHPFLLLRAVHFERTNGIGIMPVPFVRSDHLCSVTRY